MNFGRSDGRYAEEYSSNDPTMGVSGKTVLKIHVFCHGCVNGS